MKTSQLSLFSRLPESLSPREQWIRKNDISVVEAAAPGFEDEPWIAWQGGLEVLRSIISISAAEDAGTLATGPTRAATLNHLAHRLYLEHEVTPWAPWITPAELSHQAEQLLYPNYLQK